MGVIFRLVWTPFPSPSPGRGRRILLRIMGAERQAVTPVKSQRGQMRMLAGGGGVRRADPRSSRGRISPAFRVTVMVEVGRDCSRRIYMRRRWETLRCIDNMGEARDTEGKPRQHEGGGDDAHCPVGDVGFNTSNVIARIGDGEFRRGIDDFTAGRISASFWAIEWAVAFAMGIYSQMYIITAPERRAAPIWPVTVGAWRESQDSPPNAPELRRSPDGPILIIPFCRIARCHYVAVEVYATAPKWRALMRSLRSLRRACCASSLRSLRRACCISPPPFHLVWI